MSETKNPFAEGYEAYEAGEPETANPYDSGTASYLSWNDGWADAHEELQED